MHTATTLRCHSLSITKMTPVTPLIKLFLNSQHISGSHSFSSSSKITQDDGRRARRYQKFPSECYFFLTNKHYRRSHLVIISVSNLRAALCPRSLRLCQIWSCDFTVPAIHNMCRDQHVCAFIVFFLWCIKT